MARWEKHGTTSDWTLRLLYHATKIYKILGKRIYLMQNFENQDSTLVKTEPEIAQKRTNRL